MTIVWILLVVLAFVIAWWIGGVLYDSLNEWPGVLVRIAAVVLGLYALNHLTGFGAAMAESHAERQAEIAARRAEDAKPRVINRIDGCDIYAFKGGDRWHYFTRCPNAKTSTTSTYTVQSGKTTRTETETIEVQ